MEDRVFGYTYAMTYEKDGERVVYRIPVPWKSRDDAELQMKIAANLWSRKREEGKSGFTFTLCKVMPV